MSPDNSEFEKTVKECFVIMPITAPDGYAPDHFRHVFEDLILPACDSVGFRAFRADDVKQTNLIHLDILRSLLTAPMAVCDLSTHNPNVLFELALRQAFDKPVALIQEIDTPRIFDISPLRTASYHADMSYRHVIKDRKTIAENVHTTYEDKDGVNSIVKLLTIEKAKLPAAGSFDVGQSLQVLNARLQEIHSSVETIKASSANASRHMVFSNAMEPRSRTGGYGRFYTNIPTTVNRGMGGMTVSNAMQGMGGITLPDAMQGMGGISVTDAMGGMEVRLSDLQNMFPSAGVSDLEAFLDRVGKPRTGADEANSSSGGSSDVTSES